ncbi:hypothetical protein ARMGADRAFT_1036505 [Armillaria gallica]|uniref:Peptidase M23 domain-containing protein n=1 Tax=Armillaria gallica TaxID=47427 RepID=A0A2H3D1B7_ARMGA|nr:hypothetical protein ARMGADRAFT_1036505 [Armillaria gallica]
MPLGMNWVHGRLLHALLLTVWLGKECTGIKNYFQAHSQCDTATPPPQLAGFNVTYFYEPFSYACIQVGFGVGTSVHTGLPPHKAAEMQHTRAMQHPERWYFEYWGRDGINGGKDDWQHQAGIQWAGDEVWGKIGIRGAIEHYGQVDIRPSSGYNLVTHDLPITPGRPIALSSHVT